MRDEPPRRTRLNWDRVTLVAFVALQVVVVVALLISVLALIVALASK